MKNFLTMLWVAAALVATETQARDIGGVDTEIKLFGKNHAIIVEAFEDPAVKGISCFLSRAKTGGFNAALGIAEDTSDASVACRQTGAIRFRAKIGARDEVFTEKTSAIFKKMHVTRFYDAKSNSLIYLVHSDKMIDGSPKNAISAVWLGSEYPLK